MTPLYSCMCTNRQQSARSGLTASTITTIVAQYGRGATGPSSNPEKMKNSQTPLECHICIHRINLNVVSSNFNAFAVTLGPRRRRRGLQRLCPGILQPRPRNRERLCPLGCIVLGCSFSSRTLVERKVTRVASCCQVWSLCR